MIIVDVMTDAITRNQGGRDDRREMTENNATIVIRADVMTEEMTDATIVIRADVMTDVIIVDDDRRDNRKNSPAIPEPIVEGQKPQRNKGKGKDDFKKKDKDFRHDERPRRKR